MGGERDGESEEVRGRSEGQWSGGSIGENKGRREGQ